MVQKRRQPAWKTENQRKRSKKIARKRRRVIAYMKYFKPSPIFNAELRAIAQESLQPGGTRIFCNIFFEAVKEKDMYAGTLFSHIGNHKIPLLTTWGAKTKEAGKNLWERIQTDFQMNPNVVKRKNYKLHAPYVADLLFDFGPPDIYAFLFFCGYLSGDFCKCMGWTFLFPETISE